MWSKLKAALCKRSPLSFWFDPEIVWHARKTGKRRRPGTFSNAAIQACRTSKVLLGPPLRQTLELFEGLPQVRGQNRRFLTMQCRVAGRHASRCKSRIAPRDSL
ncbi:transposase [Paracoccus saliphilus]|uniref:Transposase n=1 Tax=Paracoccus saliphilus TaxID=405559 RepID=A0ABY7SH82_9RHOB|nr:transposase [Paracoccus saliphilus]